MLLKQNYISTRTVYCRVCVRACVCACVCVCVCVCTRWRTVHQLGVVVLTSVANRVRLVRLDRVDQFVLSYGGLRGAIAFALASLLDARHFADTRDLFITTTIAVIYFTNFVMVCPATGVLCRDVMLTSILEVHRLSADNRYRPFDNRHRPIIGRCR